MGRVREGDGWDKEDGKGGERQREREREREEKEAEEWLVKKGRRKDGRDR